MTERDPEKAMRQVAAIVGGLFVGFVLGDRGLASNDVGTTALAIGLAALAFAFVR